MNTGQAKYLALAEVLAEDIRKGVLNPGDRLPTQRDLADAVGVTLGTVTRAYNEVIKQGLIQGEVGRGTYVAHRLPEPTPMPIAAELPAGHIDLTCAYPIYGVDPDLAAVLRKIADGPDVQTFLRYQPSEGLYRHRAAGASWLRRLGSEARPEEVLVTCGAQHANTAIFSLVAGPGETMVTESLTYPNAKALAAILGIHLEPGPMDDQGLIPEGFEAICRKGRVRALYCIPTLQNPTTSILPEARRRKIAAIARDYDVAIVEDEVYRILEPDPPPLISSFAPERSFLIGGVSKVLGAGLRLAYVAAPAQWYKRLLNNIAATMIMAPPLTAEIASRWVEDGTVETAIEHKRQEAVARTELARRVLAGYSFRLETHAYYVWLLLPQPWRGNQFSTELYRRGVSVAQADAFAVGHTPVPNAVRVSLSAAPDRATLERALRLIAETLADPPAYGACLM